MRSGQNNTGSGLALRARGRYMDHYFMVCHVNMTTISRSSVMPSRKY